MIRKTLPKIIKKEKPEENCTYTSCKKNLDSMTDLEKKLHVTEIHLTCPRCRKCFFTRSGILKHLVECQDPNMYKCAICDIRFQNRNHLEFHICGHFHVCHICSKMHQNTVDLNRHLLHIHSYCALTKTSLSSMDSNAIRMHLSVYIQHGAFLSKCKFCDFSTKDNRLMADHLNEEHVKKMSRFQVKSQSDELINPHNMPEMQETCDFCKVWFNDHLKLVDHLLNSHKKCFPHNQKFNSTMEMLQHLKKKHEGSHKHCSICHHVTLNCLSFHKHPCIATKKSEPSVVNVFHCPCGYKTIKMKYFERHCKREHPNLDIEAEVEDVQVDGNLMQEVKNPSLGPLKNCEFCDFNGPNNHDHFKECQLAHKELTAKKSKVGLLKKNTLDYFVCPIKDCYTKSFTQVGFEAPRTPEQLTHWQEVCLLKKGVKLSKICWKHFVSSDFLVINACKKVLKNNAVPSEHMPSVKREPRICTFCTFIGEENDPHFSECNGSIEVKIDVDNFENNQEASLETEETIAVTLDEEGFETILPD